MVIGFLLSFVAQPGWVSSLVGIVAGAGTLLVVSEVYLRVRKDEGLGMGDVKMLGMIGAFLGWKLMLLTLVLGSFLGSLVGVGLIVLKRGDLKYAPAVWHLPRRDGARVGCLRGRHRELVHGLLSLVASLRRVSQRPPCVASAETGRSLRSRVVSVTGRRHERSPTERPRVAGAPPADPAIVLAPFDCSFRQGDLLPGGAADSVVHTTSTRIGPSCYRAWWNHRPR